MKLLTKALEKKLPALYSQDDRGKNATIHAKFFTPDSNWTWYVIEIERLDNDVRFFGIVDGFVTEFGYFVLSQLEAIRGPMGLPVERDLYWEPQTVGKVPELYDLCEKMGYFDIEDAEMNEADRLDDIAKEIARKKRSEACYG